MLMWRHSVRLEIGGNEENLLLTSHPSQGQQNLFVPSVIHFAIFPVIIFGVWSLFGSKQPDPRAAVAPRLVRSHLEKTSRTE